MSQLLQRYSRHVQAISPKLQVSLLHSFFPTESSSWKTHKGIFQKFGGGGGGDDDNVMETDDDWNDDPRGTDYLLFGESSVSDGGMMMMVSDTNTEIANNSSTPERNDTRGNANMEQQQQYTYQGTSRTQFVAPATPANSKSDASFVSAAVTTTMAWEVRELDETGFVAFAEALREGLRKRQYWPHEIATMRCCWSNSVQHQSCCYCCRNEKRGASHQSSGRPSFCCFGRGGERWTESSVLYSVRPGGGEGGEGLPFCARCILILNRIVTGQKVRLFGSVHHRSRPLWEVVVDILLLTNLIIYGIEATACADKHKSRCKGFSLHVRSHSYCQPFDSSCLTSAYINACKSLSKLAAPAAWITWRFTSSTMSFLRNALSNCLASGCGTILSPHPTCLIW